MTAVEWLWEQIDGIIPYQDINTSQLFIGLLEQSKEMEKKQIIDAFKFGLSHEYVIGSEQYYNKTYGSKGSDDTSSQTEISDEEIERFADEELGTIRTDFDFGVIQGMKWYREQLKQRQ